MGSRGGTLGGRPSGRATSLARGAAAAVCALGLVAGVACSSDVNGGNTGASSGTSLGKPSAGDLSPPRYDVNEVQQNQQYGGGYSGRSATGDSEAGAAFAQWVLDQDPQQRYITSAVVRGENSLGVKVQPTVTRADVQQLITSLTQGMAKTFPDRPLQVIAFYQSGDKLAEGTLNPRTGQVDVRFP